MTREVKDKGENKVGMQEENRGKRGKRRKTYCLGAPLPRKGGAMLQCTCHRNNNTKRTQEIFNVFLHKFYIESASYEFDYEIFTTRSVSLHKNYIQISKPYKILTIPQ